MRSGWVRSIGVVAALLLAGCAIDEQTEEAVNPSRSEALTAGMPACGTVLAEWNGTNAYSNGVHTGSGVSCAGAGTYGLQYQCVELVMRHFSRNWSLRWWGNAKDLLNNAPRDRVDVYYNGDSAHPPVPGDMLVWTQGTWGHVALITAVGGGFVDVIEQNVAGSGRARFSYDGARVGARWSGWVPAGWAHARGNNSDPTPTCPAGTYAIWTCNPERTARTRCVDGMVQTEACASGCVVQPTGTDDYCQGGPVDPPTCPAGTYPIWTCNPERTARTRCVAGVVQTEACAAGCVVQPVGTDDYCQGGPIDPRPTTCEGEATVAGCDSHGGCAWFFCAPSPQCRPNTTPIGSVCPEFCTNQTTIPACDATPGCAWYACAPNTPCRQRGTPLETVCP